MNRPAKVASKEAPRYVGKLCVKCVGKFNKRSSILECFKCDSMTHKVCPKSRQDKIPKTIKDIIEQIGQEDVTSDSEQFSCLKCKNVEKNDANENLEATDTEINLQSSLPNLSVREELISESSLPNLSPSSTSQISSLESFLNSIGLPSFLAKFEDEEISMEMLTDLDHETLKDLGIVKMGLRIKFMKAVKELIKTKPVDGDQNLSLLLEDSRDSCMENLSELLDDSSKEDRSITPLAESTAVSNDEQCKPCEKTLSPRADLRLHNISDLKMCFIDEPIQYIENLSKMVKSKPKYMRMFNINLKPRK